MPTSAIHRPGGTNHHHAPACSAESFCAQYSIVPQDHSETFARPRKANPAAVSIAKMAVNKKLAVTIASSLGRISHKRMRQVPSPVARAASM